MAKRRLRSFPAWRDVTLFLTALGLLVHELVIRTGPERPTVLMLLAGLLVAPLVMRADERRDDGPSPREVER